MKARKAAPPMVAPVFELVARALPNHCGAHPEARLTGVKLAAGKGTSGRVTFACGCVFVVRTRGERR